MLNGRTYLRGKPILTSIGSTASSGNLDHILVYLYKREAAFRLAYAVGGKKVCSDKVQLVYCRSFLIDFS